MFFIIIIFSGQKTSAINRAEGEKEAQILASESEKVEKINQAQGSFFYNKIS